jgi:hypothetical protein
LKLNFARGRAIGLRRGRGLLWRVRLRLRARAKQGERNEHPPHISPAAGHPRFLEKDEAARRLF